MTFSTEKRVVSRTLAAPLMPRETVPTPTPEAAATSAIVTRRGDGIVTLPKTGGWNRFHRMRSSSRRAAAPSRAGPSRTAGSHVSIGRRPGNLSDRSLTAMSSTQSRYVVTLCNSGRGLTTGCASASDAIRVLSGSVRVWGLIGASGWSASVRPALQASAVPDDLGQLPGHLRQGLLGLLLLRQEFV